MRRALPSRRLGAIALLLCGVGSMAAPVGAALREQAKLETAYRQLLGAWASGDEEGALAQLLRLDQGAPAGGRQAQRLEHAKLAVGKAIARRQPEALLAAAALEQRAYADYAGKRPTLAAEARRAVAALLGAHASADRAGRGSTHGAALFSSLAGELAVRSQATAAADFYARALALAPRQPAALLGLAAIRELHGDYAAAAELLAPLVAERPAAREARLRLAVCLVRLGRVDAAERELRALAADGADWVRSLASQELSRLLAARGDYGSAGAVLTAAAAVLPCDPSLPVQAALVAERAGGAMPLDLSTLGACGEAAESARSRYAHAPTSELVALREDVAAALPRWRRSLAQVLGVAPHAGGTR